MDVGKDETKCFPLVPSKSQKSEDGNQLEMENQGNQKNPLDIPEILSIVAGYIIQIEDLKNVRILNGKWKKETFKKWRDTAVFLINSKTKRVLLKALDKFGYYGLTDVEKEKLQSKRDPFLLLKFPFKNYRFQGGCSPWLFDYEFTRTIMPEVIVPNADYLDIGQCVISGSRFPDDDHLSQVLHSNMNLTELALAPLRKKGPANYNWNRYLRHEPDQAPNLRKLTLSVPPEQQKKSRNVLLFQEDPDFNGNEENAYWIFIRRMPNLQILHEIKGNGACNILVAMTDAATRNEIIIKLEEIAVLSTAMPVSFAIADYFRVVQPPLRVLKLPVDWVSCVQESEFIQSLRVIQDTLTKLDLEVDCKWEDSQQLHDILPEADFYLNGRHFPNMTHFKVVMDFEAGYREKILTFDLNHLRKMPKLKEFIFGVKNSDVIPKGITESKAEISEDSPSWINEMNRFTPTNELLPKGMQFDPILKDEVDVNGLMDLKSFHFHRNLEKSSLRLLGKWTKNLQTLETVLDEENVSVVRECWPLLKNLKLLKGSKVAEENLIFGFEINIAKASD